MSLDEREHIISMSELKPTLGTLDSANLWTSGHILQSSLSPVGPHPLCSSQHRCWTSEALEFRLLWNSPLLVHCRGRVQSLTLAYTHTHMPHNTALSLHVEKVWRSKNPPHEEGARLRDSIEDGRGR